MAARSETLSVGYLDADPGIRHPFEAHLESLPGISILTLTTLDGVGETMTAPLDVYLIRLDIYEDDPTPVINWLEEILSGEPDASFRCITLSRGPLEDDQQERLNRLKIKNEPFPMGLDDVQSFFINLENDLYGSPAP